MSDTTTTVEESRFLGMSAGQRESPLFGILVYCDWSRSECIEMVTGVETQQNRSHQVATDGPSGSLGLVKSARFDPGREFRGAYKRYKLAINLDLTESCQSSGILNKSLASCRALQSGWCVNVILNVNYVEARPSG